LFICKINAEIEVPEYELIIMLLGIWLEEFLRQIEWLIDDLLQVAESLLGLTLPAREVAVHEPEGRVVIAEPNCHWPLVAALATEARLDLGGSQVGETVLDFVLGEEED
jgi:hypothetical protein